MKKKYFKFLVVLIGFSTFAQQPYYNDINTELTTLTGIPLRDVLATKVINTHTTNLSYTPGIWEACKITDEDPNNTSNVLLIYGWENGTDGDVTNDLSRSKNANGGNVGDWNREHTYARSLGTPNLGSSGPGADAHHLRSSDVQRNGQRGNLKFSSGTGNSGNSGGGWYPGDQWKGDVARMMMYMYIRYGSQCLPSGVAIGTTNAVDADMIDLLLEWNAQDPVSPYEDARNTYHDSNGTYAQGNRNPFIDEPYLATLIWGGTPAEDRWGIYGGGSGDTQAPTIPTNLLVSNETSSTIDLNWTASTDDTAVTGYDIYVDAVYNSTSATNSFTVTGLTASTTYSFTVLAKDAAGNTSAQSTPTNGTTLAGGGGGGGDCATETFESIPANSSSYSLRTWTGDNGLTWSATNARTDQTLTTRAITMRNGVLTSPTVNGGIEDLTITTQRTFSGGAGTYNIKVDNGTTITTVGTVPYDATVQTTTILGINIIGSVSIILDRASGSTGDRVKFDDLSWTCHAVLGIEKLSLSNIKIYPNPASGNSLTIDTQENVNISVFDILGKQVLRSQISRDNNQIDISRLNSGMYLIRLQTENGSATKKFIKR